MASSSLVGFQRSNQHSPHPLVSASLHVSRLHHFRSGQQRRRLQERLQKRQPTPSFGPPHQFAWFGEKGCSMPILPSFKSLTPCVELLSLPAPPRDHCYACAHGRFTWLPVSNRQRFPLTSDEYTSWKYFSEERKGVSTGCLQNLVEDSDTSLKSNKSSTSIHVSPSARIPSAISLTKEQSISGSMLQHTAKSLDHVIYDFDTYWTDSEILDELSDSSSACDQSNEKPTNLLSLPLTSPPYRPNSSQDTYITESQLGKVEPDEGSIRNSEFDLAPAQQNCSPGLPEMGEDMMREQAHHQSPAERLKVKQIEGIQDVSACVTSDEVNTDGCKAKQQEPVMSDCMNGADHSRDSNQGSPGTTSGHSEQLENKNNFWDIDIETLILEDEGGESLTDSNYEENQSGASRFCTTNNYNKDSDTLDPTQNNNPFTKSISAWSDVTDLSSCQNFDSGQQHSDNSHHTENVLKTPYPASHQLERPTSARYHSNKANSDCDSVIGSVSPLHSSDFKGPKCMDTFTKDWESTPFGNEMEKVRIKRKYLRQRHIVNSEGEVKTLQTDLGKASRKTDFTFPDPKVVAERVLERCRLRSLDDSTTLRMTEHTDTFRQQYLEKMAQRRRSLPLAQPRKLQPLKDVLSPVQHGPSQEVSSRHPVLSHNSPTLWDKPSPNTQ